MADPYELIGDSSLEEQLFQLCWHFLGLQKTYEGIKGEELDYIEIQHDMEQGIVDISIKLPVSLRNISNGKSVAMHPTVVIPNGIQPTLVYS